MSTIDTEPCTIPLDASAKDTESISVLKDVVKFQYKEGNGPYLHWLCSCEGASEEVLIELSQFEEFRSQLGHRSGPRRLLEVLADKYDYDEAILTLGRTLFMSPGESLAVFEQFLTRHRLHEWLLQTLAYLQASSPQKDAAYQEAVVQHPSSDRLTRIRQVVDLQQRAREASDPSEIQELYDSGESSVWLALAGNPHVPAAVLENFAVVKEVKHANAIRHAARQTLAERKG